MCDELVDRGRLGSDLVNPMAGSRSVTPPRSMAERCARSTVSTAGCDRIHLDVSALARSRSPGASVVTLIRDPPRISRLVRLLMIGSGPGLAATRRIVSAAGLDANVHFTGLVAQEDGAQYLAASDILASPHVPNPDGTPFFGSPTKLFEYMAMGKAIAASNLDQIGEVLRHGETAWMVPPGDADALANGLARLVQDRNLRATLADAARRDVPAHQHMACACEENPRSTRGPGA